MISKRQDIGRGIEEIIALAHAHRLQRRPERGGAAEQQRRAQAQQRIPTREDHQRHRHEALPARQALVPAAGIIEREKGAADAGEKAAEHGRAHPDAIDRVAHGARGVGALADGAQDQAPAAGGERPDEQRRERHADEEQHVDLERGPHLRDVAPPAEVDRRQDAAPIGWMSGLPRKKASPVPNSISAMPTAMSLTRGKPQIAGVQQRRAARRRRRPPARRARASR